MKQWYLALVCLGFTALACSSDDSGGGGKSDPGCGANPLACPADQTCWTNATINGLQCLPANPAKTAGTTCLNTGGAADCAAGLGCFPSVSGAASGTCTPFCNNGACAGGAQCVTLTLQGTSVQFQLCTPTGTADAGTDSGSGGAGGSDAGATGGAGGATGGAGGSTDAGSD